MRDRLLVLAVADPGSTPPTGWVPGPEENDGRCPIKSLEDLGEEEICDHLAARNYKEAARAAARRATSPSCSTPLLPTTQGAPSS